LCCCTNLICGQETYSKYLLELRIDHAGVPSGN
jgi:hypothetical protein